jgi:hypothetical protein
MRWAIRDESTGHEAAEDPDIATFVRQPPTKGEPSHGAVVL